MSLKYFHIFFILCAAVLLAGVGAWQLQAFFFRREFISLAAAVILLEGAVGLVVYLVWFLRKYKNVQNSK